MARLLALALLIAVTFTFACGGDDDADSPTSTPDDTAASGDASATETGEAWTGFVDGPISGAFTATLAPQCSVGDDAIAISLQGLVAGESVVVSLFAGGPGAFDIGRPSDESPTIDVATAGETPGEWFAAAGTNGSGELTLEDDGSGAAEVTLPTIVTGTDEDITLTAEWACPPQ